MKYPPSNCSFVFFKTLFKGHLLWEPFTFLSEDLTLANYSAGSGLWEEFPTWWVGGVTTRHKGHFSSAFNWDKKEKQKISAMGLIKSTFANICSSLAIAVRHFKSMFKTGQTENLHDSEKISPSLRVQPAWTPTLSPTCLSFFLRDWPSSINRSPFPPDRTPCRVGRHAEFSLPRQSARLRHNTCGHHDLASLTAKWESSSFPHWLV